MDRVADYLMILNLNIGGDSAYGGYIDNIDTVITTEGSIALRLGNVKEETSIIVKIPQFLTELSIVYFGFTACKNDQHLHVVYYFTFLGMALKTMAGDIEIFSRFALWLNWMEPFTAGLIFCNIDFKRKQWLKTSLAILFAINFLFFGLITRIGSLPYAGCGFIWDK
jgi:hypothetical protein